MTDLIPLLHAVADLPDPDLPPDTWYSKYHDLPLDFSSLQVLQLVDLIEATFDLLLTSDDVVRAHFATPAALADHLTRRLS